MDLVTRSHISLQNIDKGHSSTIPARAQDASPSGLRSSDVGEQYATITSLHAFLRSNPFALFVNTIVLRVAETFRDGSLLAPFPISPFQQQ
jgi:hypothetical protein